MSHLLEPHFEKIPEKIINITYSTMRIKLQIYYIKFNSLEQIDKVQKFVQTQSTLCLSNVLLSFGSYCLQKNQILLRLTVSI